MSPNEAGSFRIETVNSSERSQSTPSVMKTDYAKVIALSRDRAVTESFSKQQDEIDGANLLATLGVENPEAALKADTKVTETQGDDKEKAKGVTDSDKAKAIIDTGNKLKAAELKPDEALSEVAKVFGALPQGIKDFFKPLLDFFKRLTGNISTQELKKYTGKFFKENPKGQDILEKNGVKISDPNEGGLKLEFPKDAKINGEKITSNTTSGAKETQQAVIKNGIIVLEKGAIISSIQEDGGKKITLTVLNTNGSTEKYIATKDTSGETPVPTPSA